MDEMAMKYFTSEVNNRINTIKIVENTNIAVCEKNFKIIARSLSRQAKKQNKLSLAIILFGLAMLGQSRLIAEQQIEISKLKNQMAAAKVANNSNDSTEGE